MHLKRHKLIVTKCINYVLLYAIVNTEYTQNRKCGIYLNIIHILQNNAKFLENCVTGSRVSQKFCITVIFIIVAISVNVTHFM